MGDGLAAAIATAASILGDRGRREVPIGPLTTYRVGGPAALLLEAGGIDDLVLAGKSLAASGLPVLVLGRGSNLLVADRGFRGLVVTLAPDAFGAVEFRPGHEVRAGGAVHLPVLARQTAAAGLTGLEWAVGVPGSVGGAVRMNAGGHGADTSLSLLRGRGPSRGDRGRLRTGTGRTGPLGGDYPRDRALAARASTWWPERRVGI